MTNYKFKMTMAVPPPPSSNNKNSNNKRSRKSAGPAPYLFVILLVVASSSLFHSVHLLSTSEDNALKASLKDFTTSGQRKKIDKKKSDSSISQEQEEDPTWIDQKEDPVPNPNPIADGNATFSSCLLIMDDNHRLVEWMAYHYHVLPLRYLIVAVDPRSRTSPNRILNRWRKMGMYIEEWDDFHFLKPGIARNVVPDTAALQIKRDRHRIRQKNFYHECLMHLKTANRTWVTLIDTDEFLTYNHKGGADFEEWERQQQALHEASKFREKVRIRPSQPPPTTAQEGALVHYLRQEQAAGLAFFQRSCISCPRLQFGAKESTPEERANSVPEDLTIDPDRLDTLRFRRHGHRQDFVKNGLSKSIIDVSRIEIPFPKIQSLHRPIKTICTAPWKDEWSSGLRINHYLGSWEGKQLYNILPTRGGGVWFGVWSF
jgi:hypothetical protein